MTLRAAAVDCPLGPIQVPSEGGRTMTPPRWPRPISSTSTSTPSTRSSTGRAGFPTSSRGPRSSRCRRSASPTTARWRAPSSSGRRRGTPASSRSSAARSTSPTTARRTTKGNAHLTLLAADNDGYSQPDQALLLGYLEGYYYKPRVDWELLERHSSGLIALSGCLSGRVCKALEESRIDRRRGRARPPRAGLRPRQRLRRAAERAPRRAGAHPPAARAARGEAGLPTVATGDVHYLRDTDARAHEALLCIQSGDSLKNPNHWKFETDHFYFKSPEEMALDFPGHDGRDAPHARGRGALQRRDRARPDPPAALRRAGGPRLVRLPRRALRERPAKALRQGHLRAAGAAQVRAEDDQGDGVHRLLPDRLGLHPLREDARRLRRPGPRLVGRLARRLLARRSPTSTRSATT